MEPILVVDIQHNFLPLKGELYCKDDGKGREQLLQFLINHEINIAPNWPTHCIPGGGMVDTVDPETLDDQTHGER